MTTLTSAGLDRVAIGLRIRAAFAASGKRKSRLSKEVGVSWQTVHDWVRGERLPDQVHLPLLAKALGVTPEQLLGVAVGQNPPFAAWATFADTPEGRTMTEDERRELAAHPWIGRHPTVLSYQLLLVAVRSAPAA